MNPMPPDGESSMQHGVALQQGVVAGDDGWLFLTGINDEVLRLYSDISLFTHHMATAWVQRLRERHENFRDCELRYLHVFAPDKLSVLPELSGLELPYFDRHPARLVADEWSRQGLPPILLNPLDTMRHAADRQKYYYKTDDHWTLEAVILVLNEVFVRLGIDRHTSIEQYACQYGTAVLDLGIAMADPVQETYRWLERNDSIVIKHENHLARLRRHDTSASKPLFNPGENTVYSNNSSDAIDEIVVIFGDSFMDFPNSSPILLFAEHFREVHFVWSSDIDYSYIARVDGTLVITETTERTMTSVPSDQFNLDVLVDSRMRAIGAI